MGPPNSMKLTLKKVVACAAVFVIIFMQQNAWSTPSLTTSLQGLEEEKMLLEETRILAKEMIAASFAGNSTTLHHRCLSAERQLRDKITSSDHVIVAMPAKAAGSSMADFAK